MIEALKTPKTDVTLTPITRNGHTVGNATTPTQATQIATMFERIAAMPQPQPITIPITIDGISNPRTRITFEVEQAVKTHRMKGTYRLNLHYTPPAGLLLNSADYDYLTDLTLILATYINNRLPHWEVSKPRITAPHTGRNHILHITAQPLTDKETP